MEGYNFELPVRDQLDFWPDIVTDLVAAWTESEAGILRIQTPPSESAVVGMKGEIERLCDQFGHCSVAELADAIRDAARAAAEMPFPRLTITGIIAEAQLIVRKRPILALPQGRPKWCGNPAECLDANWPEIWAKSLELSFEKGERCRRFEHDYLDIFTTEGREQNAVREKAFVELKRRVVTSQGFDPENAKGLVRQELYRVLIAAFPRYKMDIERIWVTEFEDLNLLAAEIHGLGTQDGRSRWMLRPSVDACGRAVYFDLYAEMKGCKWPDFVVKHAPKDQDTKPKSVWRAVPKSIDEI